MDSPLDPPEGDWWNRPVNRRESMWLGLGAAWSLFLFGWMGGWLEFGDQNPVGETYEVSSDEFREKVTSFKEDATVVQRDGSDAYVPAGEDVYVGAMRFNWDGLPVVLEQGTEYTFHLGSYDVQHGFSVRPGDVLSKHTNLQIYPDYEWVLPMSFDETGEYHVICNEFCGQGHRSMHGRFYVED